MTPDPEPNAVLAAGDDAIELDSPRAGVLHLVIGPSGVGKDSLIDAARAKRPDILFARRVITRPAESGGEDHVAMTQKAFDDADASGAFALSWRAHGLAYGIPASIEDALLQGRHVIANGSRRSLEKVRANFPKRRLLLVTASHEALAERLAARGRETADSIAERLRGAEQFEVSGADVITIDNGGSLAMGASAFLAALAPPLSQEPKR